MHTFFVYNDGMTASGSKRSVKDHFNISNYKVVDNGLKGEHNYKHSRCQLGMNNRA